MKVLGYALGPLVLGLIAVLGGITAALWAGAALVTFSGLVLSVLLKETDPKRRRRPPTWQEHPRLVTP